MSKGRRIAIVIVLILFVASLMTFLYPKISGAIIDSEMSETVQEIWDRIMRVREEWEAPHGPDERFNQDLWDALVAYNERIWEEKQAGLSDPWSYEQPSFTLGDYGLEDEAFGILIIPSLDIELPLYLGATFDNLTHGVAHMSQTSIPIGGNNVNSVIAGHRGWKGGTFFRHLEQIQIGAKVYVMNYWDTLEYTVVETKVISPTSVDQLLIQPGKDMLTLFSCYQKSGKQRFVVYCERTG